MVGDWERKKKNEKFFFLSLGVAPFFLRSYSPRNLRSISSQKLKGIVFTPSIGPS